MKLRFTAGLLPALGPLGCRPQLRRNEAGMRHVEQVRNAPDQVLFVLMDYFVGHCDAPELLEQLQLVGVQYERLTSEVNW